MVLNTLPTGGRYISKRRLERLETPRVQDRHDGFSYGTKKAAFKKTKAINETPCLKALSMRRKQQKNPWSTSCYLERKNLVIAVNCLNTALFISVTLYNTACLIKNYDIKWLPKHPKCYRLHGCTRKLGLNGSKRRFLQAPKACGPGFSIQAQNS